MDLLTLRNFCAFAGGFTFGLNLTTNLFMSLAGLLILAYSIWWWPEENDE